MHTGVGALEGFIRGGKNGAMAGGMGAFVSETTADFLAPKMPSFDNIKTLEAELGRSLTQEEFIHNWNDQITTYRQNIANVAEFSKLAIVPFALLTNLDADIAQNTASIAIDNNFVIFPAAVCVLMGAGIAWSIYDIIKEYEAGGTDAALKQFGIEIVMHVGSMAAGQIVFKVGSKLYPTIKSAAKAISKANPGLKSGLKKLIDPVVEFQDKIRKGFVKGNPDLVLTTHDGYKVPLSDMPKEPGKLYNTMGKANNHNGKKPSFKDIQSEVKNAKPKHVNSPVKKETYTRPDVTRMTAKQAKIEAEKLGFEKTNYYSDKQQVFKNEKNKYISPDKDGHNGGIWKMADSPNDLKDRTTRLGTYDANLNRIGD